MYAFDSWSKKTYADHINSRDNGITMFGQFLKDIPYMLFGLLFFPVAMLHTVIDILVGTSTDWKKI